jgi:pimeloyl-ACP methyl ester carboxylesterase
MKAVRHIRHHIRRIHRDVLYSRYRIVLNGYSYGVPWKIGDTGRFPNTFSDRSEPMKIRVSLAVLLSVVLATPLLGATAYRDFHPLELDTRGLSAVEGRVRDEFNHRAIGNAHIQLNGVGGNSLETYSDANGSYRFTGLDQACYPLDEATLDVNHQGYMPRQGIAIPAIYSASVELRSRTVILMHGLGGSYQETWGGPGGPFATELVAQGFNVVGIDVGDFPLNILRIDVAENAMHASLDAQCYQRGIQSFDVIAHSMGGLVSRSYLRRPNGDGNRINKLVMLAAPNHGAYIATEVLAGSVTWYFAAALFSGVLYWPGIPLSPSQTAFLDLAPGSEFLTTLNYNYTPNSTEEECQEQFDENSFNGQATIYSIAGTHPGLRHLVLRPFLGCRSVPSDGIVLQPRAYYHDGFTCTDNGLEPDCDTYHKDRSEGIAKSSCIAEKVVQLLLDGTFVCDASSKRVEENVRSRLPIIEGIVQPSTSFQDSTLINALSIVDFLCLSAADSLIYTLESPSGQLIDPEYCAGNPDMEYMRGFQSAFYSIQNPEAGLWKHYVATVGSTEPDSLSIVASFDGEVALAASVNSGIDPDADFTLEATFTDAGSVIPTGVITAAATRPTGIVDQVDLLDDGLGEDAVAGDGIYTANYPAAGEVGNYLFVFNAATDPQNPVAEYREARQVSWAARLPDPAIEDPGLVVESTEVALGGLLEMSARFTNLGDVAADSVLVTISNVSFGVVLADTLLVNLAPGQFVELGAQWLALAEGEYHLRATVEMYGNDNESNLANNGSDVAITVFIPSEMTSVPDGSDREENNEADETTSRFLLYNNYPNPLASGSTSIRFNVPAAGVNSELAIFDIRGRRVKTILAETLPQGEYVRVWDGSDNAGRQVASGVYFYRLQVAGQIQIKKLVVLR